MSTGEKWMQLLGGILLSALCLLLLAWALISYFLGGEWVWLLLFAIALGMAHPSGWLVSAGIDDFRHDAKSW